MQLNAQIVGLFIYPDTYSGSSEPPSDVRETIVICGSATRGRTSQVTGSGDQDEENCC